MSTTTISVPATTLGSNSSSITTTTNEADNCNNGSSSNCTSNNNIVIVVGKPMQDVENQHSKDNAVAELRSIVVCQDKNNLSSATDTAVVVSVSGNGEGGADSGRASVNEFDSSSVEDMEEIVVVAETVAVAEEQQLQQLSKKQCTEASNNDNSVGEEYYASCGSQTKWYLKPSSEGEQQQQQKQQIETMPVTLPEDNTMTITSEITKNDTKIAATTTTTTQVPAATTTTSLLSDNNASNSSDAVIESALSKSSIFPRSTAAAATATSEGLRNGHPINLSQQMRAVSSPSLTEGALKRQRQEPIAQREPTTNTASKTQDTITTNNKAATTATSSTTSSTASATSSTSSSTLSSTGSSRTVGVLQKFKRTLTNFNNKNQLQITPTTSTVNPTATTPTLANAQLSETERQPNARSDAGAMAIDTETLNGQQLPAEANCTTDASSGKYRFGPLIWRSSKERRKTKFNRRDKCNSGDSGIQIELENDEQFARVLAASNGGGGVNPATSTPNADKLRAVIRRSNSAKASSILDQQQAQLQQQQTAMTAQQSVSAGTMLPNAASPTAASIKAKILKKMEERIAPESLPTRSLSQPNGLETYGMCNADLDESDSDSVASHDEAGTNYYPVYAEVLYNFTAAGPQELGLERGTLIEVLRKEVGPWWLGRIKKEDASLVEEILDPEIGWFPKEFVRVIQCPETDAFFLAQIQQKADEDMLNNSTTIEDDHNTTAVPVPVADFGSNDADAEDPDSTMVVDQSNITTIVIESPPAPATPLLNVNLNVMLDNADVLRRSAIRELLETEVNYVKLLAAICEGYLPAMSKRIDIFSPNSIRLIFSNIAAIYKFQRRFLEALRKGIEQNQIAKVFLKMHKGFLCYSTYCNAYPRALIELESYDRIKDARTILENCRESENLAELPLSAHLLAPVQRICRYPLHLAEIIKSVNKGDEVEEKEDCVDAATTKMHEITQYEQLDVSQLDIADTQTTVSKALEAMRGITEAVNEGKRHSETIARHQASFQNFKGPPLHLHSTRFFIQIDATRQKQNLWNSSCTLFLFDNQLVYCKRDLIKRSHFIYKGRIFLDRCRVVNVRDGKMFGHTIKNSLRIYCEARDKWYDFSFRSANRKHRFLSTLALERQFGGKALYVSEMTGFEYNYDDRGDYSDQSDYELPECENNLGNGLLRMRDYEQANTSASGESSVPESPAKSTYRYSSDTLPKKSQSRDAIAGSGTDGQTGSLGRRRLGNWFRKPKSTNCTPSQSPTHKSGNAGGDSDADVTLTAAAVAELEAVAIQVQVETAASA